MRIPLLARAVFLAALVLGFTGVLYWVPALFGAPPVAEADEVAFIQRVASIVLEQYTPPMRPVLPVLGILLTIASAAQIPAAVGALLSSRWALLVLRVIAFTKVGLYLASGLLLGLALFSSVEPAARKWTFAGGWWLVNLALIALYYAVIHATSRVLKQLVRRERRPEPSG